MLFLDYQHITDDMLLDALGDCDVVFSQSKRCHYVNAPCSLDIETSSFYIDKETQEQVPNKVIIEKFASQLVHSDLKKSKLFLNRYEKRAIMYLWQMSINGLRFYGREWEQLVDIFQRLHDLFNLDKKLNLIVYIQNLGYEFQFMRKWFTWIDVFARKERHPILATCTLGITFKCAYMLSGYSLAKIAENLHSHTIRKLPDFDYNLLRNSKTILTRRELKYAQNDVLILEYFIIEEIKRNGNISNIPLTNTGYVRRYCRDAVYNRQDKDEYKATQEMYSELTIEYDEYQQLKRAFQGGFTHANARSVMKTHKNLGAFDLTSAYPAAMVQEYFPMSKGQLIKINSIDEFYTFLETHHCIFDIGFTNIESITFIEHPISASKCWEQVKTLEDNGRIVEADLIWTTMTEIDFKYMDKFYTWDKISIDNLRIYEKGRLPKNFIKAILQLYQDKTTLKGMIEKAVEYIHSKGMLNSAYGMTVTDIIADIIQYFNHEINTESIDLLASNWSTEKANSEQALLEYNTQKRRFLFYPWGLYVTAYVRRSLFSAIHSFGSDYVYSDTDSIYAKNHEKHLDYIDEYNKQAIEKNIRAMRDHNLPMSLTYPKDPKGRERHLGVWDDEGICVEFKTLGAKRYMYTKINKDTKKIEHTLTTAGVGKSQGMSYILSQSKKLNQSPFDLFKEHLFIPPGHSGKMIVTYIDNDTQGIMTDYQGHTITYHEKSSIHMEETHYSYSIGEQFSEYLNAIWDSEYI